MRNETTNKAIGTVGTSVSEADYEETELVISPQQTSSPLTPSAIVTRLGDARVGRHQKADEKEKPLVLLAVEPRSYREALGLALSKLRSDLNIVILKPETAASEWSCLSADIVVNSLPPPRTEVRHGTPWVRVVFPAESSTRVAIGDGPLVERSGFDLSDLLEVIESLVVDRRSRPAHRLAL